YRLLGAEGWDLAAGPWCPAEGEIARIWSPLPGEPLVRIRQRVGDSGLGAPFASVPHTPGQPGGGPGGGKAHAFSKPHTSGPRSGKACAASEPHSAGGRGGAGPAARSRLGGADGWGLAPARSAPSGPISW